MCIIHIAKDFPFITNQEEVKTFLESFSHFPVSGSLRVLYVYPTWNGEWQAGDWKKSRFRPLGYAYNVAIQVDLQHLNILTEA